MSVFHSFFIDNSEAVVRPMNGWLCDLYFQNTQRLTNQALSILVGNFG